MSAFRVIQRSGLVLFLLAVTVAAFVPGARPGWGHVGELVAVGLLVGVAIGVAIRFAVPFDRRLQAMHALSPRLARRVLPPSAGNEPNDSADE
jgi:hypothetical protein